MAAKTNLTPEEFCYDYLTGGNGDRMLFYPVTNYVHGDHGVVHDMISDPDTLLGLGDGGAHCGLICDSSLPSYMLTHWVRDRTPRAALPAGVRGEAADQRDRGLLRFPRSRPAGGGKKADVNVVDLRRCGCITRNCGTTCRPAASGWCSVWMATKRRSSPACRSSSAARKPVPVPASWSARPQTGNGILRSARGDGTLGG